MKPLSNDTNLQLEALEIERLRTLPAWRKLELVGGMNRSVRQLALVGLRRRHPHASAEELRRRLADLQLGPELAARVYGPLELLAPDQQA